LVANLKAEKQFAVKDAASATEEANKLKSQLDSQRSETGKRAEDERAIQDLRDKNRELDYQKKEFENRIAFLETEKRESEREKREWEREKRDWDVEKREVEEEREGWDAERRQIEGEREAWERDREGWDGERGAWEGAKRGWEQEKRGMESARTEAPRHAPPPLELTPHSPAPAAPPPPPSAPPPPPPMPAEGGVEKEKPFAARAPKKEVPAGGESRDALLDAIRKPKQLNHVRESLIVPKDVDLSTTDPSNIVGILARALIDRRADIGEDEDNDEEENVGWDD